MNYNFSDRVRRVLLRAREEACRMQHRKVSTEHMLLGLMGEPGGSGAAVLVDLGIDSGELYWRVLEGVVVGDSVGLGDELPLSYQAKKALQFAMDEAHNLGHDYIGTMHLLIGLIRQDGVAAQALASLDVTLHAARMVALARFPSTRPVTLRDKVAAWRTRVVKTIEQIEDELRSPDRF